MKYNLLVVSTTMKSVELDFLIDTEEGESI